MNLNGDHFGELKLALALTGLGGAAPVEYRQWRRFEALRQARYLKLNGRRNVRWDRTFYDITDKGRVALQERATS
jgi:hypothetical protein